MISETINNSLFLFYQFNFFTFSTCFTCSLFQLVLLVHLSNLFYLFPFPTCFTCSPFPTCFTCSLFQLVLLVPFPTNQYSLKEQIILHSCFSRLHWHSPNTLSMSFRCCCLCNLLEPVAGLLVSGRAIIRRGTSLKLRCK